MWGGTVEGVVALWRGLVGGGVVELGRSTGGDVIAVLSEQETELLTIVKLKASAEVDPT